MSRIIQQIATVQFQVDNRKVTASMNALQTEAESLNGKIADVKQNIKDLGDVPTDNKFLLDYQKQLRQLNSDLKDVTTAQRDLMKGVKAADQLWKAARTQDIESLSIKAIKAGQNGLRKRMDNLRPELGGDEQKMYDAYKAVIDEADRVMNVFKSNYATVVQTIRDGGIVSEQVMKSTRDSLKDLMEAEKEGTAEHRQLAQQYDFLNESLANVAEMRRREKGEIVNANDARREALKLTEDGIAAARRERDMADAVIAGMQQQKDDLDQLRRFHEDRIAQTEREIAANQRLEEAEQDRLADVEKAMRYNENEDRKEAIRLRKKADAARDEAEAKKEAYEEQAEQEKLLRQRVKDTGDEVTNLTAKIEALGKTEAKPKVDTSGIDELSTKLEELKKKRNIESFEGISFMQLEDRAKLPGDWELERSGYMQKFLDKFGLQDSYAKRKDYIPTKHMFHGPEDSDIWDIEGWYNGEENGWGYTKEDWKKHLDDYKWFEDNLRAVTDAIKAQYEKLGQASREGVDPESLKGVANGIKKLEALKERMLSVAAKDKDYGLDYGIGGGEWFRKQFGDVEGDMKKAVETVERGLKEVTGMRSSAYKKKLEEEHATWKEKAENSEKTIRELEREIKTIELTIAAINGETEALEKQEQVIGQLKEEHQGLVNAQVEAHRKNELLTTGEIFSASGEKLTDKRAFQASIIEEAQKISPYTSGDQFVLDKDQTKALVENLAKQYKVAYKEMEDRLRAVFNGNQGEGSLFTTSGFDTTFGQYYVNFEKNLEAVHNFKTEVRDAADEVEKADRAAEESSKKVYDAQLALKDARQKSTEILQQSTAAEEQSADVAKQKKELEDQRTEATKRHTKAVKDYEAQQEKTNKAQEKAYKAQEESVALNEKAATAEEKVAHQEERHAEAMDQQSERLRQIRAEGQRLLDLYEQQKTELQTVDKAWADADVKQGEAEARKAQNQELTIKSLDDSIRKLKEANAVIDTNSDEWEENTRIIRKLQQAQDEISQKQKEMLGEWMSLADAQKMADSVGTSGFVATDAQIKQATEALNRHRESLIKTIQERERDGQATAEERSQLTQLDAQLAKLKTGFGSADEVMQRFNEHMNAGKTASEGMASAIDEKLSQATSGYDTLIEDAIKEVENYEQQIREATQELADMEKELAELEAKHKNSSWFRKQTKAYRREAWRIEDLRDEIEGHEVKMDDGSSFRTGKKQFIEDLQGWKQSTQGWVDFYKKQKAEELGITEEVEEKKQDAQRLTQEQMQQGIKLLEEEYAKTEHTTEAGIKRREQLRETIDQMNKELKESTGEWMTLADAMKLAGDAEQNVYLNKDGKGFTASPQDMQKATQALERQRDVILQTIKAKRDSEQATDAEEKELADLTSKLKALKFEQDNFNMSQAKMQELMRTPTNAVSLDELRNAIKRADGELKRMEGSLGKNNKEYKEFSEQVRNAKNMLKEMEGQAKASATAWEKAWSRLKTYVVMYMGFNAMWNKLTGTADDLMELSDKMGEVSKTTNLSAEAVGELSRNLAKLDVRTPLQELMSISASAGQLGLKTVEDIQGFTEAANKLMIALPEMGKEAATEMMRVAIATGEVDKIRKQMQEGLIDGSSATAVAMEKIASTIDRLRASSASTAPEITDFVKRLGAVGAQSGISIDQVAALGSTISSLGMRVEMSATALSRMIPAIKNNAFAIANAVGVAPEALRSLFEAGRGMEAILMIFQHLKDQNANADSIEKLLGIGGMQDVMKQLNQQGARAGIVFAGLSQNVDELRKQLVTANEAYEENVAITNEFNRMNETTAAKWERFKNQIQEMFVSDWMQRIFGGLIDGLRWVLDLLVGKGGLSPAIYTIITLFTILKLKIGAVVWSALAAALIKIVDLFKNWRIALDLLIIRMKEMTAAQFANVFIAIAAAVGMLIYKLQQLSERTSVVANEMAKANEEILKQTGAVDQLFRSVAKTNVELENARKRLDEVKKSAEDTTDAENQLKKANTDHAASIREINSKYGQYLGYMLSETSSAEQLARARELINAKLRETITLKQQEAALGSVEQEYGGKVNKKASDMEQTLQTFFGNDYDTAARVSVAISEAAQKYAKDSQTYQSAVKKILANNKVQADVTESYMSTFEDYRSAIEEYTEQEDIVTRRFEARTNANRKKTREATVRDLNAILADWKDLVEQYRKAEGEEKEKLAAEVYKQQRSYANAVANNAEYFEGDKRKEMFDKNIKNMQTYEKGLREVAGEAIRTVDAMERAEGKVTGIDYSNDGQSGTNPWGGSHEAASTDWKNMTANQLVERRKQMNEFVKAIQTDTDVQSVLKEDAALKKAIENGMSSDMSTVIEWYNTERLKIQDELHARHLTNTGDWMDPKKQRARKKMLHDETKAFLDELDAYYTERKAKIQEAQSAEGLSEAEAQRQIVENEVEWRQRRMELQKLYGDKSAEVSQEEQDAIASIIAERMDDDDKMVKAQIQKTVEFVRQIEKLNEQGANEAREFWGKMDKGAMQDLLRQANATAKQMEAIRKIIAQERPYDGLVDNLRENLTEMGILFADMEKANTEAIKKGLEKPFADSDIVEERFKRLSFLMEQVEQAYDLGIDELTERMEKEGFGEWAKTIRDNHELQDAMMAQLHQTYDKLQDAIKKESSLIKKHVEIMWADIKPGQQMSLKDSYEAAINAMGLQQDQVSRANQLIGAGQSSERVADKLAIKQIQLRIAMQQHYYNLMELEGRKRIAYLAEEEQRQKRIAEQMKRQTEELRRQGREEEAKQAQQKAEEALTMSKMAALDKEHLETSLNLSKAKEQTEQLKLQQEMVAKTEESQNRLYTQLKEWGDLLASSMREVMEASHAGDKEYYNELAKLELTGRGGPGAGTYVVIDDEGTSDAKAHYEYLDQRQAIERQREIEQQNALAEAWKKVFDDINAKISETITDQLNAMLQNAAIYDNTAALRANTEALTAMSEAVSNSVDNGAVAGEPLVTGKAAGEPLVDGKTTGDWTPEWQKAPQQPAQQGEWMAPMMPPAVDSSAITAPWAAYAEGSRDATKTITDNNKKAEKSTKASFAAMTAAANMYGIAYQTMANDNLSTAQKVEMMIVQAAGQAMISMLTAQLSADTGATASQAPNWVSKTLSSLGPIAGPAAVGVFTALIGGLMGIALSKVSKSKSQIAQATGASASAGKLTTGMLAYAEGNVNEFSDPKSLTPGRTYDVDAADGRTYRARYMGTNPSTHLTNGPEFHLAGERGREMIIDAGTTRQITMNDNGIWHAIQTLSSGGRMRRTSRRGVRAFADGNVDEFEEMLGGGTAEGETGGMDIAAMTEAMNRQTAVQEALLERLNQPIVAQNIWTGPDGIPNMYNKMQKEAKRHGVKFL